MHSLSTFAILCIILFALFIMTLFIASIIGGIVLIIYFYKKSKKSKQANMTRDNKHAS